MDDDSILSSDLSSLSPTPSPPSPTLDYPSPVSSQEQDTTSSVASDVKKRKADEDDSPAPKKRKRAEPKPRTTERLDLTGNPDVSATEQNAQLDILLKVLRKRRKIVVIAGAGISVSAGIPDFRSSTGLFKSLKSEHKLKASGKQLFDASVYQNGSSTSTFHDMVRSMSGMISQAKPTAFHQMLSTLGQEGRLLRLYTQNVDGIDVALPSLETNVPLNPKGPWPRTVQLHGGLEKMVCSKCNTLSDFEPALFNGPDPPPCSACIEADRVRTDHAGKRSHGIGKLRPRIVLYNEHNPDEDAIGAVVSADLKTRPDAIIVVGTSMKIPGVRRIVREMCSVIRGRRDGLTVWINQDPPPSGPQFEDCWDLIVKGPCDEVARQWVQSNETHTQCTDSDVERAKERTDVQVVISASQTESKTPQGILTPVASPAPKGSEPIKKIHIKLNLADPTLSETQKVKPKKTTKKPKTTAKAKPAPKEAKPQRQIKTTFKVAKPVGRPPKAKTFSPTHEATLPALERSETSDPKFPGPFPKSTDRFANPKYPERVLPSIDPHAPVRVDSLYAEPYTPVRAESISSCTSSPLSPLSSEAPSPPGSAGSLMSKHPGTVSPTTIPRGMQHLID